MSHDTRPRFRLATAIADIPAAQWDALAGAQPFVRHAFLDALERSHCVHPDSGWQPQHLTLWQGGRLVAALPLYAKSHSFGEFVFDWAWADACERAGLRYYPKLLTAAPFSPVQGPRLLAADEAARERLLVQALQFAAASGMSSWHVLFPCEAEAALLAHRGLLLREGVQFHWHNAGYRDFGDFLGTLARDKRKKIRQERRRVAEADVCVRRLSGREIGARDWEFFVRCYKRTYHEHRSVPYLNLTFFEYLGQAMPENLLMLVAERGGRPIAAALNMVDEGCLYGRYWGALEQVPCLHFELCFYQGIELCIERGLALFEGGAQGEHKLARGFVPTRTLSAHWLADARLRGAIERHLARETAGLRRYVDELNDHAPFRSAGRLQADPAAGDRD